MKSKNSSKKKRGSRPIASKSCSLPYACAFGAGIGGVCAVICLFIAGAVCMFSSDPDSLISPLALISSALSFFLSGFAATKKRPAPLWCGTGAGGILTAVFFIISLFLSKGLSWGLPLTVGLLIRLSMIGVAVFGAMMGANVKVNKRKRRNTGCIINVGVNQQI